MSGYAVLSLSPEDRYHIRLASSHMDGFGAWSAFHAAPAAVLVRLDDGPGGLRYTVLSAKGVAADRLDATPDFAAAITDAVKGEAGDGGDR
ncbi:MAG TPA: hypothetical protein VGF55_06810 [Gemmataceae bacterium]|jgi:hypothetical protein